MTPRPAPPPAPFDSVRAVKAAMQAAALAPASAPGQVAAFLQIVLAAALASAWLDDAHLVVITTAALGASILIGLTTPLGTYFRSVSGVIVALCAVGITFIVHALTDARLFGEQAPWVFVVVALVPIGLDWRYVPRLRARTVCSGLVVIPLIGAHESWTFAAAVLWFVGALTTLWVLERDVERAAMRPVRLAPTPADAGSRARDLLRAIGLGLAVGLVVAFLVGDVSCTRPASLPSSLSSDRYGSRDLSPSANGSGFTGGYRIDDQGRRFVDGTDGSRWYVDDQSGRTVLRGANGSVRGEIQGDSVTLYDENGGIAGRYRYDPQGRLVPADPSGSGNSGSSAGPSNATSPAPTPTPSDGGDPPWRWIVAVGSLAAAGAAALVFALRRRREAAPAPDWAHRMAARLDDEGRRRGQSRARGETVVDYTAGLFTGPLPDARLHEVARIVSAAMFGRHEADAEARSWVERTLDEITAAHPAPRRLPRAEPGPRRQGEATASASTAARAGSAPARPTR